jgi:integrase
VRTTSPSCFLGEHGGPPRCVECVPRSSSGGQANGVPWVGLHTLRHTCATLLVSRGLNAKQVQAWLGHHKASFTLDVYIHLLVDELPDISFLDAIGEMP